MLDKLTLKQTEKINLAEAVFHIRTPLALRWIFNYFDKEVEFNFDSETLGFADIARFLKIQSV